MYHKVEPGCFGISICYDPQSNACANCTIKDQCVVLAKQEMEKIGQEVNVADLRRRFGDAPKVESAPQTERRKRVAKQDNSKRKLTPLEEAKIRQMKKKPAAVAKTLFAMSINVNDHLSSGVNPFNREGKLAYLSATCDLLLEGGFDKKELKSAFLSRFPHWSERTAEGYVSLTVSLLVDLGVVIERVGKFVVKEKE